MGQQTWEYVFGFLERLNHYLLFKWTRKGLQMPAIVILLTHRMDNLNYVMDGLKTKADRVAFLNARWKGNVNRICIHTYCDIQSSNCTFHNSV